MSRIRYLDIDTLNERLEELEDLEAAIAEAKDALDEYVAEHTEAGTDMPDRTDLEKALEHAECNFTEDERKELQSLRDLKDQIGERRGKIDDEGGPFIHENDFEEYAREFAEDIGAIDRKASWPNNCIDWGFAAKELQMDYTSVDWDGVTYYYRG